jgi:hypothetical protein
MDDRGFEESSICQCEADTHEQIHIRKVVPTDNVAFRPVTLLSVLTGK